MASSIQLGKRKRRGRNARVLVEGDDSTLDTAMYQELQTGNSRQRVLVPVRLDVPTQDESRSDSNLEPFADDAVDENWNGVEVLLTSQRKTRAFYMKEYVSRIKGILQAIQAREALPDPDLCSDCRTSVGRWRCQDCVGCQLMCRRCMRHSHTTNPFHRITRWTGTYFREAALWEVGVCLTVGHQDTPKVCPTLKWQQDTLEQFQLQRDAADALLDEPTLSVPREVHADPIMSQSGSEPEPDLSGPETAGESSADDEILRLLDSFLEENGREAFSREDEHDEPDTEGDIMDVDAGLDGFVGYMGEVGTGSGPDIMGSSDLNIPLAPKKDALNNQYVRVVHLNGIHHIALVCCSCRGHEHMVTDLVYSQLIPTSFDRIRTLFTTAVLDHFRYCNLDMKSSAYQFFQLLRRITLPMNPSQVVNLYHELRRLSRLWRWTKKLKWAGYGQHPDQPIDPKPGGLANFCPACPQVGINVAANWLQDPKRWVFRRGFTVDGNFKANHVRQNRAEEDIWLYDGLGMTTRRLECQSFLRTAFERTSVSSGSASQLGVGPD
jgi:hypothetical protein